MLGPLEAYDEDRAVEIGGGRQRALLALLLVHAGEVVSRDFLIDSLWAGRPPAGVSQSLDAYLSRLRKALRQPEANNVLVTRPPGYVLHAPQTDAGEFGRRVREGREVLARGDYERAVEHLRAGLALWRGKAYVEVADEAWARPEVQRLEELRLAATEDRIEAELALGRHSLLVPELELLTGRHPTRERLVGQLMVALYRSGRQADALAAYRGARRSLVEELGLDPSRDLQRIEAAVLAQDPALDPPAEPIASLLRRQTRSDAPEAQRKQVTVLVAGVVGPLGVADGVDAEDTRRITQRLLSILCAGVHRLEGTVDRFTGDGITALFGAPIAHEDHARRACYAALHLKEELGHYGSELEAQGVQLPFRIGLSSGEVVVGAIGDGLAMQYTAIGPTVGLAQRVEQAAAPRSVYLTESTASLAQGYFALADRGELDIPGFSRRVPIRELIGVGVAQGTLDVSKARGFSPFVGRSGELCLMEEAVEQAIAGEGQVIGIVGEPGVGKSRLCHEFAERQRANGIRVHRLAGLAHAKAVPLVPVLQFLRAYFEITDDDSPPTSRHRIASRLLDLDADFGDDLPLIFDFLSVPDPGHPPERMDPEARQRRLVELMKRLSRTRNLREPGITIIEDLHWLDPASERFVADHVGSVPGTRGVTILNFRPEFHARWMSRASYRQIALAPLNGQATGEMLTALLGSEPSMEGVVQLLTERTRGNPFFIEEIVRSLVETATFEGEPGNYRLVGPVEHLAVPPSVHAVVAARIDRLSSAAKTVLQAAAVIGNEVARPILEHVASLDPSEFDNAVRGLVDAGYVSEDELYPHPRYTLTHPLTAEVAYRSLLAEQRVAVHVAVAQAIEARYPERLDEWAALLAHHWEAAGNALEAARWHTRAATWSGSADPHQARHHWLRVRELAESLPESQETLGLRLRAGSSLLNYGWRLGLPQDETEALFVETDRLASVLGDVRARAFLLFGCSAAKQTGEGQAGEAAPLARQALALADESGDSALYLAVSLGAYVLFCTGAYDEVTVICNRAIELADGDPTVGAGIVTACPYASCHVFQALATAALGQLPRARRLFEQARAIAGQHGDAEVLGWSHMWSVWLDYFVGDHADVVAHARRALDIAERLGGSFSRTVALFHLGGAHWARGEWKLAVDALERSRTLAVEHRHHEHDGWRLALLGEAYLRLGDGQLALGLVGDAVKITRERGNRFEETHANLALARVLLDSNGPSARPQIEAALQWAMELVRDTEAKAFEPLVHVQRAELARRCGDQQERKRELRLARRLFVDIGATGHAERIAAQVAR